MAALIRFVPAVIRLFLAILRLFAAVVRLNRLEGGKMYQIPLDQFAESGAIKKFAVTITFDQPSVLGWTGGGGGIGFSTDKEWQTADFEHGFIDGAKNTVR